MSVTLSLFAGAGAQFFDDSGAPLTGGKVYSYAAGTSSPLATYTSFSGNVNHPNPIILDAAGRVPSGGEIWLQLGIGYKFIVKTAQDVLIATYDNIPSSAQPPAANNASSIMYEQGYVATAGSFVAGKTYQIATIGTTDFTVIGAVSNTVGVYFIATGAGTGTGTALLSQTVQAKLQQYVSVKDFGAVGNGVADDTAAIQAAIDFTGSSGGAVYIPTGNYKITATLDLANLSHAIKVYGDGDQSRILATVPSNGAAINIGSVPQGPNNSLLSVEISDLYLRSVSSTGHGIYVNASSPILRNMYIRDFNTSGYSGLQIQETYGGIFENLIFQGNWNAVKLVTSQANGFYNLQTFTSLNIGVHITRNATNPGDGNKFYNIWCENNDGQDIVCETSNNLFSGGWLESAGTTTAVVEVKNNAYDSFTSNNIFENFYWAGGSSGSARLLKSSAAQGTICRSIWWARGGNNFLELSDLDTIIDPRFNSGVTDPIVFGGSIAGSRPYQMIYSGSLLEKGTTNQNVNYILSYQFGNIYATKRPNDDNASKAFYVSSTGDDAYSGFNSALTPALNIQNLIDLAPDIDASLTTGIIIQLVSDMTIDYNLLIPKNKRIVLDVGTYTLTITNGKAIYVGGLLVINADPVSPGSVIADNSANRHLINVLPFAECVIFRPTLTNNSSNVNFGCIYVDGGRVTTSPVNLSSATGIVVTNNGFAQANGTTGTCTTNSFVATFAGTIDKTGSTVTGATSTANGGAIYP